MTEAAPAHVAKLITSGHTQRLELPEAYRLDADAAWVRRRGRSLVLEPIPQDWAWLDEAVGTLSDAFEASTAEPSPLEDKPVPDTFK